MYCSVRYPVCNAQAPYCHLWPVGFYKIFPICLIKGTILKQNYGIQNVWFNVLYNFFPETFLILRITEENVIKNVYSCQILMKFEFS